LGLWGEVAIRGVILGTDQVWSQCGNGIGSESSGLRSLYLRRCIVNCDPHFMPLRFPKHVILRGARVSQEPMLSTGRVPAHTARRTHHVVVPTRIGADHHATRQEMQNGKTSIPLRKAASEPGTVFYDSNSQKHDHIVCLRWSLARCS
jgi:hypothetical protein